MTDPPGHRTPVARPGRRQALGPPPQPPELAVACPTCHAPADERCTTRGRPRGIHESRRERARLAVPDPDDPTSTTWRAVKDVPMTMGDLL